MTNIVLTTGVENIIKHLNIVNDLLMLLFLSVFNSSGQHRSIAPILDYFYIVVIWFVVLIQDT